MAPRFDHTPAPLQCAGGPRTQCLQGEAGKPKSSGKSLMQRLTQMTLGKRTPLFPTSQPASKQKNRNKQASQPASQPASQTACQPANLPTCQAPQQPSSPPRPCSGSVSGKPRRKRKDLPEGRMAWMQSTKPVHAVRQSHIFHKHKHPSLWIGANPIHFIKCSSHHLSTTQPHKLSPKE